MLAVAGFDFILMDCEHGPADVMALRHPHRSRAGSRSPGARPSRRGRARTRPPRARPRGTGHRRTTRRDGRGGRALVQTVHYPPVGRARVRYLPSSRTVRHRHRRGPSGQGGGDAGHRDAGVAPSRKPPRGRSSSTAGDRRVPDRHGRPDAPRPEEAIHPCRTSVATIHQQAAEVGCWRADLAGSPEDAQRVLGGRQQARRLQRRAGAHARVRGARRPRRAAVLRQATDRSSVRLAAAKQPTPLRPAADGTVSPGEVHRE